MDTKYSICSRALIQIGANAIASFDDETAEAEIARELYESTLEQHLVHPWRFAMDAKTINQVESDIASQYGFAYRLPATAIALRTVRDGEEPIAEYEVFGNEVHCDYDLSTLEADFTIRRSESYFPKHFTKALELELAWRFAAGLSQQSGLANTFATMALEAWSDAKTKDAQQDSPIRVRPRRLLGARSGR